MSQLFDAVNNVTTTENGALTHKSSLNKVLDLFSMGGAMRNRPTTDIVSIVKSAYAEDNLKTIETLLYLRDIRGGQGERKIFREGIKALKESLNTSALIKAIVEVGSWKDVFTIFTVDEYAPFVKEAYEKHISEDKYDLMEKWMPSIGGGKNKEAEALASKLGLTPKQYRKYLSKARATLNLVETNMCSNKWGEISYSGVPSRAGLLYRSAFIKHDNDRYRKYLADVMSDKEGVKMNAKTLYPYEITKKIIESFDSYSSSEDESLEALWKSLPNYCGDENALVVADTSGSMTCFGGMPMAVSTSLAIYFAERNKGAFHNEFITFSGRPVFHQFKEDMTLSERVAEMIRMNICDNTDLKKTFEILLERAKKYNIPKSEMPKTLYVVSDMEFDIATYKGSRAFNSDVIRKMYEDAGYDMPNLIFWNVNSHQNNVPVTFNEQNVALVSGCSPSVFGMAISGDLNPLKFMLNAIEVERYKSLAESILA